MNMQQPKKTVPAGTGTLKLSKRTVMLYASTYEREVKATRQRYVAGFSRSATEIPPAFLTALHQLVKDPERRQALLERIDTEVLVPARRAAMDAERRRSHLLSLQPLSEARRALGRATRSLNDIEVSAELREEFRRLDIAYQALKGFEGQEAHKTLTIDDAIAAFTEACKGLSAAVQALPKRCALRPETVNAWQRSWYLHQDTLATATSRAALKRPAGWSSWMRTA
jgi:hypothetical protein